MRAERALVTAILTYVSRFWRAITSCCELHFMVFKTHSSEALLFISQSFFRHCIAESPPNGESEKVVDLKHPREVKFVGVAKILVDVKVNL